MRRLYWYTTAARALAQPCPYEVVAFTCDCENRHPANGEWPPATHGEELAAWLVASVQSERLTVHRVPVVAWLEQVAGRRDDGTVRVVPGIMDRYTRTVVAPEDWSGDEVVDDGVVVVTRGREFTRDELTSAHLELHRRAVVEWRDAMRGDVEFEERYARR